MKGPSTTVESLLGSLDRMVDQTRWAGGSAWPEDAELDEGAEHDGREPDHRDYGLPPDGYIGVEDCNGLISALAFCLTALRSW
jgi:hypothetical protein